MVTTCKLGYFMNKETGCEDCPLKDDGCEIFKTLQEDIYSECKESCFPNTQPSTNNENIYIVLYSCVPAFLILIGVLIFVVIRKRMHHSRKDDEENGEVDIPNPQDNRRDVPLDLNKFSDEESYIEQLPSCDQL